MVVVPKKDGTKRICVDYRPINRKIIKDRYPLPLIEDQIDALQGARVYSTLDLANGFFHVPVSPESTKYTAFITSSGQYEFLKAPFGLCLCPPVFQRFINTIFSQLIDDGTVIPYMDDIVIPAKNEEEALDKLKRVLQLASEYGLNIKWKKCSLLQKRIEFLGQEIENGTIRSSPTKTNVVKNYKEPTTVKEVQKFLGLAGYFRKFIEGFAMIAKPLSDLLRQNHPFQFGLEQRLAFQKLKKCITQRPVLTIFEYGLETEVHTDASKVNLAAVLLQRSKEDNEMHPVRYLSSKTSKEQEKWTSYELEILAVVYALSQWRVYLIGQPFTLVTDCKAFQETMNKKGIPKVARWAMKLQEYDMKIVHRTADRMKHVDALSRVCFVDVNGLLTAIKKNQMEDDHLKLIIEILKTSGIYRDYFLSNDVLYIKTSNNDKLIVIPERMELEIIKQAHDMGHFKVKKWKKLSLRSFTSQGLKKNWRNTSKIVLSASWSIENVEDKRVFYIQFQKEINH